MENKSSNLKWFLLAIITGLGAVGIHFYLATHFYDLKFGLLEGKSACNVSSTFNCDVVSASKYAQFLSIPMALWGSITNLVFVFMALLSFFGMSSHPARLKRYVGILGSLLLAASLVMGAISLTQLSTYCLFCIATYLLSIGSFIGALKLCGENPFSQITGDLSSLFGEMKWVLGALALIPIAAFIFNDQLIVSRAGIDYSQSTLANFNDWNSSQSFSFSDEGLVKGPIDAKMKIVEFADYRCPHCKHAAPTLKAFTESHPDVRFIYKAFPLDGTCNPSPQMPDGPGVTCYLARSVHCVEQVVQKGFGLKYNIFENQENIIDMNSAESVVNTFRLANSIPDDAFNQCLNSEETLKSVERQAQEGLNAQIRGTPTVFVNGRQLKGGQTLLMLNKVYESIK